jgi:hypothetical protein
VRVQGHVKAQGYEQGHAQAFGQAHAHAQVQTKPLVQLLVQVLVQAQVQAPGLGLERQRRWRHPEGSGARAKPQALEGRSAVQTQGVSAQIQPVQVQVSAR